MEKITFQLAVVGAFLTASFARAAEGTAIQPSVGRTLQCHEEWHGPPSCCDKLVYLKTTVTFEALADECDGLGYLVKYEAHSDGSIAGRTFTQLTGKTCQKSLLEDPWEVVLTVPDDPGFEWKLKFDPVTMSATIGNERIRCWVRRSN